MLKLNSARSLTVPARAARKSLPATADPQPSSSRRKNGSVRPAELATWRSSLRPRLYAIPICNWNELRTRLARSTCELLVGHNCCLGMDEALAEPQRHSLVGRGGRRSCLSLSNNPCGTALLHRAPPLWRLLISGITVCPLSYASTHLFPP